MKTRWAFIWHQSQSSCRRDGREEECKWERAKKANCPNFDDGQRIGISIKERQDFSRVKSEQQTNSEPQKLQNRSR
jgi:hypothetical protein